MGDLKWWQKAVFYQIYPRSFADGNGDGIGDFKGMLAHLDYLKELGVDAVWLSPHFPSPGVDCGYDVSDYLSVAPEYGSLEEFKAFLDGLHVRGMHLILDLVLNHTSDQHPWFLQSRSSRDSLKRDWYVWRPGVDGGPPNNWNSGFGGSAWELDPHTGEYYYHYFFKQQPDLNWRNPQVKQAMFEVVRFWLEMGVDGFRLDAIGTLFEDPQLVDHNSRLSHAEIYQLSRRSHSPQELQQVSQEHRRMFGAQLDRPEVHDLMRDLRRLVDEYPDKVLVGESDDIAYYGDGTDELHLIFNFPLMKTDRLTADFVRHNQNQRLGQLPAGAWPCNTLGNHDSSRLISHFASNSDDPRAQARLLLGLLLTLRGTPFLYNGEEIGMTDWLLHDLSQVKDSLSLWVYEMELEVLGSDPQSALEHAVKFGRDKCRTPLQWDQTANAGFCPPNSSPWLPVNSNYAQGVNVAEQDHAPGSLLNFYRRILWMRKRTPALVSGDYLPILPVHPDCLVFLRHSQADRQTCLVVINFSSQVQDLTIDNLPEKTGLVNPCVCPLYSSHKRPRRNETLSHLIIEPYEVFIAELERT